MKSLNYSPMCEQVTGYDLMRVLLAGVGARISYPGSRAPDGGLDVKPFTLTRITATERGVALDIRFDGDIRDRTIYLDPREGEW